MRFWSALAVEESQVLDWWVPADLAIGFKMLWSQLCFCLRSDMTAGMLHGTCASVSAPMVLVSPGRSSQESSMAGNVWQQQRSQPPAAPDLKSGVHHMSYIVVGERRRISHTPQTNTKVWKMTKHPHISPPALPEPYVWSRSWQPTKVEWLGMELNATDIVASCPQNEQPVLASSEKKSMFLHEQPPLSEAPSPFPLSVLPRFFFMVGVLVCRWEVAVGTPNWKQFKICSQSYVPGHHLFLVRVLRGKSLRIQTLDRDNWRCPLPCHEHSTAMATAEGRQWWDPERIIQWASRLDFARDA